MHSAEAGEWMDKILVVSSLSRGTEVLTSYLEGDAYSLQYAASGGEARRRLLEESFSLVIILAPLKDESGISLAEDAAGGTAGILLAVKAGEQEELAHRLTGHGIFVYSFSMGKRMFEYAAQLLLAVHRRLEASLPQKEKMERRVEDILIVNRANCLLIQYLHLSEEEAHRLIEKQAMDKRKTKREVAEEILRHYEIE